VPELALSVIVIEPLIAPAVVGSNSTRIVHCAPTASDVMQLLLCEKLLLATMLLIVIAVVPVLVNVTVCDALVVPTVWPTKVKLAGEKLTTGAVAAAAIVIDSCAVAVFPFASTTLNVNVLDPGLTGVPDKTPLEENPIPVLHEPVQAGSLHVYGAVPFKAVSVAE
jgi:hypothetical protein